MNDPISNTMNKARIEALSDGLFSVAMTFLIFFVKIPTIVHSSNGSELLGQLVKMWPMFRGYFISFAILGMYWIAHHGLFHYFAKQANRSMTYLNILFLCLIVLIPFSTYLIDEYPMNPTAVAVYGLNIIVISMVQYWMFRMTINDPQAVHESVTPHLIMKSTVRILLPPVFAAIGIIAGFFHSSISFFLFAFPVVVNITPGSLDYFMRMVDKKVRPV
jgi:uncharacterized membrane protein